VSSYFPIPSDSTAALDTVISQANRRFDPSTLLASHYGGVAMQSYQYSLFLSAFCNLLNRISEIMGPSMKLKQVLKLGSLTNESLIGDVSWNQLTSINGGSLYVFKWSGKSLF
jgi:hypothetical protein